jgi:hypothetical protein
VDMGAILDYSSGQPWLMRVKFRVTLRVSRCCTKLAAVSQEA